MEQGLTDSCPLTEVEICPVTLGLPSKICWDALLANMIRSPTCSSANMDAEDVDILVAPVRRSRGRGDPGRRGVVPDRRRAHGCGYVAATLRCALCYSIRTEKTGAPVGLVGRWAGGRAKQKKIKRFYSGWRLRHHRERNGGLRRRLPGPRPQQECTSYPPLRGRVRYTHNSLTLSI